MNLRGNLNETSGSKATGLASDRFYLGPLVIGLEDVTIDITYPTPFYLAKVPYALFVCCYGE